MCHTCSKLLDQFLAEEKLGTPTRYVYVMVEYNDNGVLPFMVVDNKSDAMLVIDDRPADTCNYLTVPLVGTPDKAKLYQVLTHQGVKPSGCPGTFIAVCNDQAMAHRMLAHFRRRENRWWRRVRRQFTILTSRLAPQE